MEEFKVWLCKHKKYKEKSASDVCSRLKRVCMMLGQENAEACNVDILENNDEFKKLTISVRSQLRKSVRLYLEFKK